MYLKVLQLSAQIFLDLMQGSEALVHALLDGVFAGSLVFTALGGTYVSLALIAKT